MTNWDRMFGFVQSLVRTAPSINDGLGATVSFARRNPHDWADEDFWTKVTRQLVVRQPPAPLPWSTTRDNEHNAIRSMVALPVDRVAMWAREGLANLPYQTGGWDALVLDLGDCPEIFSLARLDESSKIAEDNLRQILFSRSVLHYTEFEEQLGTAEHRFEWPAQDLVYHNVRELRDDILSWNIDSYDYKGHSGYLLWLALGSLTLVEPFRAAAECPRHLKGRDRLYLLSGFEEIFTYLATITREGIEFEA